MAWRTRGSLVGGLALVLACSDSGPADVPAPHLAIERVAPPVPRIEPQDTLVFAATIDGAPLAPETLSWSASNRSVLRLLRPGRFVAKEPGFTTVRAASRSGTEAWAAIQVFDPVVASIFLPPGPILLRRTEELQLRPIALDRNGNPIGGAADRIFLTTAAPSIATVDENGFVKAINPGETRILATLDAVTSEVVVRVRELPPLELQRPELQLHLPGDRAPVMGTVEGSPAPIVALRLVNEARWLHEHAVVQIRGDTVVALAPGRARLEASVALAFPDTLRILVEPTGPTVYFGPPAVRLAGGAAVELRGWGLDDPAIKGARVGGQEAPILARDSATLRLSVPMQESSGCEGNARRSVEILAVALASGSQLVVARPDELSLEAGAAVQAAPGSCLKLPADPLVRWAMAVTDGGLWSTRDRPVPTSALEEPPTELVLLDRSIPVGGAAVSGLERPDGAGRAEAMEPARHPHSPWDAGLRLAADENRPYQIGDTIRLVPNSGPFNTAGLYRALEIVDGHYVIFYRQSIPPVPDSVRARVAAAVDTMDATMGALLDPAVSGSPRDAFGQYVILVRYDPGPLGLDGLAGPTSMWLNVHDRLGEELYGVLLHEFAHSYQSRVVADEQEEGLSGGLYRPWSWEGLADLTAYEVRRRAYGIPLDANLDLDAPGFEFLTQEGLLQGGRLLFGYFFSAGLFRDVARRWSDAVGATPDSAFREIFTGATLGWWGCSNVSADCSSRGLAERLADGLGHEVDPADVILDWTLAQAGDDRLASMQWSNPLFRLASGSDDHITRPATSGGWAPVAVSVAGHGDASFELSAGAAEWIAIADTEGGGTTLRLPDDPRWRWKLLRVR